MVDFQKLMIWQKAHQLTLDIYKITDSFPKSQLFTLVSQMRRSSASIPTNIAEGSARGSKVDFNRFLIMSQGSNSELHYQIILSKDLNYISIYEKLVKQTIEVRKMTHAYQLKLLK
jgi:four helix bundle protein